MQNHRHILIPQRGTGSVTAYGGYPAKAGKYAFSVTNIRTKQNFKKRAFMGFLFFRKYKFACSSKVFLILQNTVTFVQPF